MSLLRRSLLSLAAAAALAGPAHAAEVRDFSRPAFAAAQAANRPIVVEVKAVWCPTCLSQEKTIRSSISGPEYAKLVVFQINYDKQKADWQSFDVHRQGTILAFQGVRPVGRLDFVTDKAQIRGLLAATVR